MFASGALARARWARGGLTQRPQTPSWTKLGHKPILSGSTHLLPHTFTPSYAPELYNLKYLSLPFLSEVRCCPTTIGLYRDVWIAAIASSRTRLATLTGAMCKTSQCELRSLGLRVNSGMLNVIRIVTYYTLPPLESPDLYRPLSRFRDKGLYIVCKMSSMHDMHIGA